MTDIENTNTAEVTSSISSETQTSNISGETPTSNISSETPTSNISGETQRGKSKLNMILLIIGIIALVSVIGFCYWYSNINAVPKENKTDTFEPTKAAVKVIDNTGVKFEFSDIIVNLRDYTGMLSLDLNDIDPTSINIASDYDYITYSKYGRTLMYEVFIGKDPEAVGDWSKAEVAEYLNSTSNETLVKESESSVGTDSHMKSKMALKRLYDQGFVYVAERNLINYNDETGFDGELNSDEYVENIVNSMRFIKGQYKDVNLTLDGLGDYNLSDLSIFKDDCGILFGAGENTVYLWNNIDQETKLFISYLNNVYINNNWGKLIPYKEYNNVYIDYGFRDHADWGYGGFAVTTNIGTYYFKIGEGVENAEAVMDEILNWLGVSETDEKIETHFTPTMTMDDLKEPTVDSETAEIE